jgi:hypothetical protein
MISVPRKESAHTTTYLISDVFIISTIYNYMLSAAVKQRKNVKNIAFFGRTIYTYAVLKERSKSVGEICEQRG